jgi:hypothetical protein
MEIRRIWRMSEKLGAKNRDIMEVKHGEEEREINNQ